MRSPRLRQSQLATMTLATPRSGDDEGDDSVELLCAFLGLWSDASHTQRSGRVNFVDYSQHFKGYLARTMPPPLPKPLPRSFRPSEVVPGLYLGAANDVQDAGEVVTRLRSATRGGGGVPHALYLLVRACPSSGITAVRLERRGIRQVSKASTASQTPPRVVQRDICLETFSLEQLWEAMGRDVSEAVVGSMAGTGTPSQICSLQQFLSTPYAYDVAASSASPTHPLERGASEENPPHRCTGVTSTYWRLVLPIRDSPEYNIAQHLPLTNVFLHAVMTLPPLGGTSTAQQQRAGSGEGDGVHTKGGPSTGPSQPCAVVHCMAGRSRSTTIVASYLLYVWASHVMTSSEGIDGVRPSSLAALSGQNRKTLALKLIDALLSFIRTRRAYVEVNSGFYDQLAQFASQQLFGSV